MDKRDNMKQAMYEMFGVGKGRPAPEETLDPIDPAAEENDSLDGMGMTPPPTDPFFDPIPTPPKPATSFLAEGATFEGSLHAKGDVEIAGEFKGELTTEGSVRLYSDIESNITAKNVDLFGCVLTGEIAAHDSVNVDSSSRVIGDISAGDLLCSGEVTGDLNVSKTLRVGSKARIRGNIVTGALNVELGAAINGNLQVTGFAEVTQ